MTGAIWLIVYGLRETREPEYLDWFHRVHVPEKLARPGYRWASHYRIAPDGGGGCIALFGAVDASVFYNPSPAQIKPTQPAETRDMMGCRVDSRYLILSAEWAIDGAGAARDAGSPIDAKSISLTLCDADGQDEDFGAWLVQVGRARAIRDTGCTGMRKYLASTGGAKHAVFHETDGSGALPPAFDGAPDDEWTARVRACARFPLGAPVSASLIHHAAG